MGHPDSNNYCDNATLDAIRVALFFVPGDE